jgi:hypothetical protein
MANPSVLHDDGIKTGTVASTSVQPTTAPTAGNLAVLNVTQTGTSSGETITDTASNTWTKKSSAVTSNSNVASQWVALLSSVAGSPYKVNLAGMATLATPWGVNFQEIINFDSTTPVDGTPAATNYANAASTTISQPVGSATVANDLAICVASYNSAETTTPTAPMGTTSSNNTLASPMWVGTGTITGTGSTTLAGTFNVSTRRATAGLLVKAQSASVPIAYNDDFDFSEADEGFFEDDNTLQLIIASDSAPVAPNQPAPPVQDDAQLIEWWQDYEDPTIDDAQWSGPVQPQAPPALPVEDPWLHEDDPNDEILGEDSAPVGPNQPPLPVADDWDWAEPADYTEDLWEDDGYNVTVPNQPAPPVEDAWDWAPEDYTDDPPDDDGWITRNPNAPVPPQTPEEGWDWSAPEDLTDDLWEDDGSNVQNANVAPAAPNPVEDGWDWSEPDDLSDEPPDDDGSNVQNTNLVLLPANGPEDAWNWDEEAEADSWWDDCLDDGYNVQNNNVTPPVIGPPPVLPTGTLLPGDLGEATEATGTGMGPYKRPGQVFGEPDPVSPWLTSRADAAPRVAAPAFLSSLPANLPPEAVTILETLGPDLTESDVAQVLIALELLLHGGPSC